MSADLIQRLRDRRVTNWVHSTGTPPRANGFAHDADCQEAATELERLTAELAAARAEADECDDLREKLSGILRRTADALRGPAPKLTLWSWHDLPERAAAAIAAIDVMQRAANELAAEVEGLRADAERYRWLRSADNDVSALISPNAMGWQMVVGGKLDAAIDAARQAGEIGLA